LKADAPRPSGDPIDLASAGIGLLASGTDVTDEAEAMLRARYTLAPAE